MTAAARVALVVDNTGTQKQRSWRSAPTKAFLTDKHPIYGGKAEVVTTQQSGGYLMEACASPASEYLW